MFKIYLSRLLTSKFWHSHAFGATSKFLLLFSTFLLLTQGCRKDLSPVNEAEISLTLESSGVTDVWLKLTLSETDSEEGYLVERDGQQIAQGKVKGETLVIDEGLLPKHTYNYIAYLYDSSKGKASASVTVTTLDTTSHNFTWEVDTLGAYGSYLKDVAIVSDNNVWVIGNLQIGIPPNTVLYNAVHWNGSAWTYEKIPFKVDSAGQDSTISSLEAVVAIADDDIWVTNSARVVHFDGNNWSSFIKLYDDFNDPTFGGLYHFWANSSSDIWGVGKKGNIFHYDGTDWYRINSGVTVDLHDIAGNIDLETGQTRIWIAGERTLLYSDDGKTWQVVWDQNNPLLPDGFNYPAALFIPDHKRLIISTASINALRGYQLYQNELNTYRQLFSTEVPALSMDGNGINDMILAGSYYKISHFNGANIKEIDQFSGDSRAWSLKYKNNNVFIVGSDYSQSRALVIRGKKVQ